MIDTALQMLLVQRAGVASRVTPSTNTAPVSRDLPRIIYTLIDDPSGYTDSGPMTVGKARYQVDVFAATGTDARNVIARLQKRSDATPVAGIDGYSGTLDQTEIRRVYFGSTHMGLGTNVPGQEQTTARATVDAFVDYRELQ